MKRMTRLVCLVAWLIAAAGTQVSAQRGAPASGPVPQLAITKVVVAADGVTLMIDGVNFGDGRRP